MIYDFTKDVENKKIIVAPLNWGLGHATRCIPLIRKAISLGAEVIIASDGLALSYLKEVFPDLKTFELPSYKVTYKYESMVLNGIIQLPRVLAAIRNEHKMITQIVNQEAIELIISDNRFGCHSKKSKNIFITHQLNIIHSNLIFKLIVNFQNRRWLKEFDSVWVPDYTNSLLSGDLSNVNQMKGEFKFIGPLSIHQQINLPSKYDVLFLLSGPEPQRTIFENMLIELAIEWKNKSICFISGTHVSNLKDVILPDHIDYYTTVYGDALTSILNQSELLISRSGYSTLMDLHLLDMKSILIPTPGQTEQEYLAIRMQKQAKVRSCQQNEIKEKLINLVKELQ